jgi:hypothetical protein
MVLVRFTPTVAEVEAFRRARPPRARGFTRGRLILWAGLIGVFAVAVITPCWMAYHCPVMSGMRAPPTMSATPQEQADNATETFIHTLPYFPLLVLLLLFWLFLRFLLTRGVGGPPHPALYRTQRAAFTEAGFVLEDGFSRREGGWSTLYGYSDTPSLLLLYPSRDDPHLVPKRAFDNPAALAWVMWVLATRARRV